MWSFRDCASRICVVFSPFYFASRFLFACPSEWPSGIYDHNVLGPKVWTWNWRVEVLLKWFLSGYASVVRNCEKCWAINCDSYCVNLPKNFINNIKIKAMASIALYLLTALKIPKFLIPISSRFYWRLSFHHSSCDCASAFVLSSSCKSYDCHWPYISRWWLRDCDTPCVSRLWIAFSLARDCT